MDAAFEGTGAWIFLSHSHKDFDKVRELRNKLEAMGHHPLMFFLKCINDDSEVDDLVRREIEAREWFILCDSDNSRVSRWVRREVDIIRSGQDKVYTVVDLDAPIQSQVEQARALTKRATVFISCAHADQPIANEIAGVLRDHDFGTFNAAEDLTVGSDCQTTIRDQIRGAAEHGFVLVLVSQSSMRSLWVAEEIKTAFSLTHFGTSNYNANVVPVVLDRGAIAEGSPLMKTQWVDFSEGSNKDNTERLIAELKKRKMQ